MASDHSDFTTLSAAEAFYDQIENQHDRVSLTTNYPEVGMFRVSFGDDPKQTYLEFVSGFFGQAERRREEERKEARDAEVAEMARWIAAQEAAQASGLSGREADVFAAGFAGHDAKRVNPRAEGLEPVFRAGRAAWAQPESQRRYRVAMIEARRFPSTVVINPEQD